MQSISVIPLAIRHSSHSLNLSVTQAMCRANMLTHSSSVNTLVKCIGENMPKMQQSLAGFIEWINMVLFNVCAANQQLIAQYDNQLLQSTESIPKTYLKSKQINEYNQVLAVKNKLKQWLEQVLVLPFFQAILTLKPNVISRDRPLKQLLQTVDYLIGKYQLNLPVQEQIKALLNYSNTQSNSSNMSQIYKKINKNIFSSGQQFASFMTQINTNYQIQLQPVAQIVCINYEEQSTPRNIFQTAQNNGVNVVEECIDYVIRKINKTQLFAQSMESFRPFQLLINIIVQKQAAALIEWNSLIIELDNLQSPYTSPMIHKLATFMSVYLINDYPRLHYLLKYLYSSLLAKYSSNDSLELIKKFILNRLFLSPTLYSSLFQPTEEHMKRYVQNANKVRILFYEKKVNVLAQHDPKIVDVSQAMIKALKSMLSAKEGNKNGLNVRDKGVYVNDKILSRIYNDAYDGLQNHQQAKQVQKRPQANESKINKSDISLSFSLKNDSRSRAQMPINASQAPHFPANASSIDIPKPTQRTHLSPKHSQLIKQPQVSPPNSNSERSHSSLLPQMSQLEELIHLRRQYGQLKRQIENRCSEKKKKRQERERILYGLNQRALELRKELKGEINEIMINNLIF